MTIQISSAVGTASSLTQIEEQGRFPTGETRTLTVTLDLGQYEQDTHFAFTVATAGGGS
jgi:hypothetical protein